MAISTSQILKKIGNPKLNLVKGEGYWYFIYDDIENNLFETHSVYTMYLNSMSVDIWVSEGMDFLKKMEG